jgi:hypothetical protein
LKNKTNPQTPNKNPPILEILEIKNQKTPILLELPVPEKSFPYLVGNTKENTLPLTWAEHPSPRNTTISWGVSCSIEEIISCMFELCKNRGEIEKWENFQICENDAKAHLSQLGITETRLINGNILVPSDPSLLGSIIIVGNKKFPLIHNPYRGICFIKG